MKRWRYLWSRTYWLLALERRKKSLIIICYLNRWCPAFGSALAREKGLYAKTGRLWLVWGLLISKANRSEHFGGGAFIIEISCASFLNLLVIKHKNLLFSCSHSQLWSESRLLDWQISFEMAYLRFLSGLLSYWLTIHQFHLLQLSNLP